MVRKSKSSKEVHKILIDKIGGKKFNPDNPECKDIMVDFAGIGVYGDVKNVGNCFSVLSLDGMTKVGTGIIKGKKLSDIRISRKKQSKAFNKKNKEQDRLKE